MLKIHIVPNKHLIIHIKKKNHLNAYPKNLISRKLPLDLCLQPLAKMHGLASVWHVSSLTHLRLRLVRQHWQNDFFKKY